MNAAIERLIRWNACEEGRGYIKTMRAKGFTDQQIWEQCDRPDFLMWFVSRCISPYDSDDNTKRMNAMTDSLIQRFYSEDDHSDNILMIHKKKYRVYFPTMIVSELVTCFNAPSDMLCVEIRNQFPNIADLISLYKEV